MSIITHNYSANAHSMSRIASINGNRVFWDSNNYVTFAKEGRLVSIKSVHIGFCEWENIYFDESFKKLKDDSKDLIAAAALAMGLTTVKVGKHIVTFVYDLGVAQPKVEALTDQPYSISGHRKEAPEVIYSTDRRAKVEINVPDIKISGKGGWFVGLAVAAVVVAGVAVAASRN